MDNNIFENGWDAYNAYAYGWIMSDGCLLKEGRNKTSYAVRVTSCDLEVMQWLHDYMCVGNKIYTESKAYTIKFRNNEAISFMRKNCLTERKSLTMDFPNVPDVYLPDFIRGYFDGDGSIILKDTKWNTYGQVSFTCGSLVFLEKLQAILASKSIASHIYADGRTTNKSYYLRITKRSELEKLYALMYYSPCVPKLERKYSKYSALMSKKLKYNIA